MLSEKIFVDDSLNHVYDYLAKGKGFLWIGSRSFVMNKTLEEAMELGENQIDKDTIKSGFNASSTDKRYLKLRNIFSLSQIYESMVGKKIESVIQKNNEVVITYSDKTFNKIMGINIKVE